MKRRLYHADDSLVPRGPVDEAELRVLHAAGTVTHQTWVVEEGGRQWAPYGLFFAKESDSSHFPRRILTAIALVFPLTVLLYFALFSIGGEIWGSRTILDSVGDPLASYTLGRQISVSFAQRYLGLVCIASLALGIVGATTVAFSDLFPWCRKRHAACEPYPSPPPGIGSLPKNLAFPFVVPGWEQVPLVLRGGLFFSKILHEGKPLPKMKGKRRTFFWEKADGCRLVLRLKSHTDLVPDIIHDGHTIQLLPPLPLAWRIFAALPVVLAFLGGIVGGLCAALAWKMNLHLFRKPLSAPAKVAISLFLDLAAWLVLLAWGGIVGLALHR